MLGRVDADRGQQAEPALAAPDAVTALLREVQPEVRQLHRADQDVGEPDVHVREDEFAGAGDPQRHVRGGWAVDEVQERGQLEAGADLGAGVDAGCRRDERQAEVPDQGEVAQAGDRTAPARVWTEVDPAIAGRFRVEAEFPRTAQRDAADPQRGVRADDPVDLRVPDDAGPPSGCDLDAVDDRRAGRDEAVGRADDALGDPEHGLRTRAPGHAHRAHEFLDDAALGRRDVFEVVDGRQAALDPQRARDDLAAVAVPVDG